MQVAKYQNAITLFLARRTVKNSPSATLVHIQSRQAGLYKTYILPRRSTSPAGAKSQGKLNDSERRAEGCPFTAKGPTLSHFTTFGFCPRLGHSCPVALFGFKLSTDLQKPADLALCLQPATTFGHSFPKIKIVLCLPLPFVMSHQGWFYQSWWFQQMFQEKFCEPAQQMFGYFVNF